MADKSLLPDAAARRAITEQLDTTLFVEAGAGSGKTTALVGRLVALVEAGHDLGAVAAITFTEKAAAELRDRVRVALERAADDTGARPPEVVERCRRALDALDAAAIGTLHSFAQRLLREHPVEAGLPPVIEVMDEIGSQVAFEERWTTFQERLFTDPALERVVLLAFAMDVRLRHLEEIAADFDDDWDLVAERVERDAPDPSPLDLTALVAEATAAADLRRFCLADGDHLCTRLDEIADWCTDVMALGDDEVAVLESLARLNGSWTTKGRKQNWGGTINEVRAAGAALATEAAELRERMSDACVRRIGAELARFTLAAAEDRRRHGQLQFHDLLVLARELLRGPDGPAVRATLHQRYQHLLLDEFQDTDPIQIELALRIAAPPEAEAASWTGLQAVPGRLFVVGDPKQSIYRFRRADIGLFLRARNAIGDGEPLQLHTNFRTVAPVVEWVNHVFGSLIQPVPGAQPSFQELSAVRPPASSSSGPAVTVVGAEPHHDEPKAEELREREAASIAAAVATILRDGWLVADRSPGGGADLWHPARPGDVAVLLPARTSLPALQQALDHLGVPHRAESSSLVYATPEVRALLMAARAVDDPTDELAVVSTLRSSLFGCSDPELFDWVQRAGRWSPLAPLPPPRLDAPDPVHDAMTELAQLTRDRAWRSPSELLAHLVSTRRVLELATEGGHAQDLWRRVRFVVDQARAWGEAGGIGLRAYLHWAARQRQGGARAAEVVLPETDLDAVRIMTIHAAKGLEFPITVVSGLSTRPKAVAGGGRVIWTTDGGYELKAGSGVTTARYDEALDLDEQLDHHERLRLLYVACTRAQDHLVVSLHRTDAHDAAAGAKATSATLLAHASDGAGHAAVDSPTMTEPLPPAAGPAPADGAPWAWADIAAWRAERTRALAASGRRRTVAATTLAQDAVPHDEPMDPGLAKDQRDLELPPWQKGRYGTAVGRAVHAVLQTVDLTTGEGLAEAAAAQAAAEGVADRSSVIEALARSALQAPAVRTAAAVPHWRELYVAAPVSDTLLEGYIDLLYRDADGLVVVDYKTDHLPDEPSLEARLEHYRRQGAAYAVAVEQVTQETVARCVFVFCAPEGARQRELTGLRAAMAEIVAELARSALPVP